MWAWNYWGFDTLMCMWEPMNYCSYGKPIRPHYPWDQSRILPVSHSNIPQSIRITFNTHSSSIKWEHSPWSEHSVRLPSPTQEGPVRFQYPILRTLYAFRTQSTWLKFACPVCIPIRITALPQFARIPHYPCTSTLSLALLDVTRWCFDALGSMHDVTRLAMSFEQWGTSN